MRPCRVAARAKGGSDLTYLVREILNPLCSEDGWLQTVAALDDATKQSIVHLCSRQSSEKNNVRRVATSPRLRHRSKSLTVRW